MADPMSDLSPEKINAHLHPLPAEDDVDMTWHDPPSSPFVPHVETEYDQENIAPLNIASPAHTPAKHHARLDDHVPQSAFKVSASPSKMLGLKERKASPVRMTPSKLLDPFDESDFIGGYEGRASPGTVNQRAVDDLFDDFEGTHYPQHTSPEKSPPRTASLAQDQYRYTDSTRSNSFDEGFSPAKRPSFSAREPTLRVNEGLTVAMEILEVSRSDKHESHSLYRVESFGSDNSQEEAAGDFDDFQNHDLGHPGRQDDQDDQAPQDEQDEQDLTMDDTCFSNFSEMPNLDMTKFAALKKSPTKEMMNQATPRARPQVQMTPSTVRRSDRTPSPTPRKSRKENAGDTTNLLLDFTAQIEAFSAYTRSSTSPNRGRKSPTKSTTEPNLLSFLQNQRSPAKPTSHEQATPARNRQVFNLLDFELPPPPTPRSVPTVTIREMESLKSTFQSQISSLTASLSGKEAEVESLVKAVSDAERRVGSSQEQFRDERSAREHAEAQMVDWKNKGEEVQKLLQDVQSELARNDQEREALLFKLVDAERRAEDAEHRSSELETRVIEAESKNVDMTTFINPAEDEEGENRKIYSEVECQMAISEKVNEVARDLHTAYKAKHEKKIKALKENYQKKADERCKDLRLQIIRLERQVEEAEKKIGRDDTFQNGPCADCETSTNMLSETAKHLEHQNSNIENLKAKMAGLTSELSSLRKSHDQLLRDLETERVEKGELVAAAEQMLSLYGEKMEEMAQEELRKSQMGRAPPAPPSDSGMRSTGFLGNAPAPPRPGSAIGGGRPGSAMGDRLGAMGEKSHARNGSGNGASGGGIARPSGLKAPRGFGFGGSAGAAAPGLNRSTSGGSGKSRILSNIERMGGTARGE